MKSDTLTKKLLYSIAFVLISVSYQNCGSFQNNDGGSVQISQSSNGDIVPIANTKTASIVRASRTLDSLVSCLGVKTPSTQAIAELNKNKGTISEEGLANSMTQPMAKSLISVSAQVCNDLINNEKPLADTERMIFKGVNFNAGKLDSSLVTLAAKRISRSCWGRNPTQNEVDLIVSEVNSQFSTGTDNSANTVKKMIYLCTAMAASFASYEM
jgi:uncharacterized protein YbcC (UPF0753/DUF2309 family)